MLVSCESPGFLQLRNTSAEGQNQQVPLASSIYLLTSFSQLYIHVYFMFAKIKVNTLK